MRASGPFVPKPVTSLPNGALLIRPRLGLMPTRPLMLAGMRIDPPPSLPCANGTNPAATATAAPPLEPPACRPVSHGQRAGPTSSLVV